MFPKFRNYTNREINQPPKRKLESKLPSSLLTKLIIIGAGGFMIGLALIIFGLWQTGDRFWASLEAIFRSSPAEPEVDISSIVVERVRGASELTTAIFTMEAVVPASQDRKVGNLTVGQTKLLYIARGEVRAGVDLSKLKPEDVQVRDNLIQVILPPPQILDSKIDVNRSQVYDYDRGFLSLGPDVAPQLQLLAQRETLKKIQAAACEQGLLQQANERAEITVSKLLGVSERETTSVITTPPSSTTCTLAQSSAPKSGSNAPLLLESSGKQEGEKKNNPPVDR